MHMDIWKTEMTFCGFKYGKKYMINVGIMSVRLHHLFDPLMRIYYLQFIVSACNL